MVRAAMALLTAGCLSVCLAGEKPKPKAGPAKALPKTAAPKPKPKPKPAKLEPGTYARIRTGKGEVVVRLLVDEAERTVENFVELAKGERPWKDRQERWVARPFYDGLTFHRIEKDSLIQGGCPKGDGTGGPGYEFDDEISDERKFDKPGLLAMANSGRDTNGSQFFLTLAPMPHLNTRHTIFGEVVRGLEVVKAISAMAVKAGASPGIHLAKSPVVIRSVAIEVVGETPKDAPKQGRQGG